MTESENTEQLQAFYEEVRESFRVSMRAEEVDRDTVQRVLETVDDNV